MDSWDKPANTNALSNEPCAKNRPAGQIQPNKNEGCQLRTVILIAGMHRSGTSALSHTLGLAGCDLPHSSVMHQNDAEGRRRGYAESLVITQLNKDILSSVNRCEFEKTALLFQADAADSTVRGRALAALQDEYGDSRLAVLKDPRLCLLLEFWIDAVEAFGARPVVICPIRNPLEVVRSLKMRTPNREGASAQSYLYLLWLRHVLDAEAASRSVPRIFTRYSELLNEPMSVLGRIEKSLDISLPKISQPCSKKEIRDALCPIHRTHLATFDDLCSGTHRMHSIERVYEILDRWVDNDVCFQDKDRAELDSLKMVVDDVTASLADWSIDTKERIFSEFRNSNSWRITAPLRALKRIF